MTEMQHCPPWHLGPGQSLSGMTVRRIVSPFDEV